MLVTDLVTLSLALVTRMTSESVRVQSLPTGIEWKLEDWHFLENYGVPFELIFRYSLLKFDSAIIQLGTIARAPFFIPRANSARRTQDRTNLHPDSRNSIKISRSHPNETNQHPELPSEALPIHPPHASQSYRPPRDLF
ncbi:hypothetical protein TNCV_2268551 [Trichonephila clavipes]|nr:hypothetical protein TNCV_2268551 [Trichonephila clavipes]